uniref:aromatase n=1 Tax=Myripristis murdjan TaxID=586833 RepID=A0A667YKA1_9TELE
MLIWIPHYLLRTQLNISVLPHMHHLLALLLLVVAVCKLTALIVKRRETLRNLEAFPGPPAHWLFGHVQEVIKSRTPIKKQCCNVTRYKYFQYPFAFQIWFGPFVSFLNIHHPDYVKTLLSTTGVYGLLVSSGQKWFRNRRLLTPGFHYDILKPYVKLMSDSAKTMLDKWESYAQTSESFELFEHVSLMTLDSIMKCAFSLNSAFNVRLSSHFSGTNAYIKAVYDLSFLINLRFRVIPYHNNIIFHLSPHGFRFRKAVKVAHHHTEEVIRKRREELKKETELDRIQAKRNLDFLDILLCARDENQHSLSDEDIRAEVDTFMFEGHDTTASGISFILYCLACNPEHQQMCRDEITYALEGKDTIDWEDLSKIPYTTMCIKESLRLYPPVPGIARKITKPLTFFDGRTAAAGHCCICVYLEIWVFDPLRFLPENVSSRSPHAFVPFSAGPRNCIGQTFAMNEMKVVIALTLRRYQLIEDPDRKPKVIPSLVLRSLNGIHIKIKPVDHQP